MWFDPFRIQSGNVCFSGRTTLPYVAVLTDKLVSCLDTTSGQVQLLGVSLDKQLTWSCHTDRIEAKMSGAVSVLIMR